MFWTNFSGDFSSVADGSKTGPGFGFGGGFGFGFGFGFNRSVIFEAGASCPCKFSVSLTLAYMGSRGRIEFKGTTGCTFVEMDESTTRGRIS